jgi:hypothetical protein
VVLNVVADRDREQREAADHCKYELGVFPRDVRDPGHRGFNGSRAGDVRRGIGETVPDIKVDTLIYQLH